MITPQDIQAISFDKAVFGGYDMQSVDEVLEPLTQDYLALYKENAVLKSKMRLLVEKLEEYRAGEETTKAAQDEAKKKADEMLAEAERKCAAMVSEAKTKAETQKYDSDAALSGEKERLNRAKVSTREFISAVEANIQKQLEILGTLKLMDLEEEEVLKVRREPVRKPYDYESEKDEDPPAPPAEEPVKEPEPEIADEIVQSVGRLVGDEPAVLKEPTKVIPTLKPEQKNDKFENLQFGPNYKPTE